MNRFFCKFRKILSWVLYLMLPLATVAQKQDFRWILPPTYENIILDGNHAIKVKLNGVWGLVGYDSKTIMEPTYDFIDTFNEGIAAVEKNQKIGFIDTLGRELVAPQYQKENPDILDTVFDNPMVRYKVNTFIDGGCIVNQNGNYKLIGINGNDLLPKDIEILKRSGAILLIRRQKSYGLAAANGTILVDPQYPRIEEIAEGKLFSFFSFGKWGLLNEKAKEVQPIIFTDIQPVQMQNEVFVKAWTEDGKQMLLNSSGEMLFPAKYQSCMPIEIPNYYRVENEGSSGIVHRNENIIITPQYEKIRVLLGTDTLFVVQKDYNYTVFDTKGNKYYHGTDNVIIDIIPHGNLLAWHNGSCGVMNKMGTWIVEPQYEEVYLVLNNVMAARKKNKWGALSIKDQQVVIPFEYKQVKAEKEKNYIVFCEGKDSSVLVSKDGIAYRFPKTDDINTFPLYVQFETRKGIGRLYPSGQLIAPQYKGIVTLSDSLLGVKDKKGWRYARRDNQEILSPEHFGSLTAFIHGYAAVIKENKILFLDTHFQPIFTICQDCQQVLEAWVQLLFARLNNKSIVAVTIDGKQGVLQLKKLH